MVKGKWGKGNGEWEKSDNMHENRKAQEKNCPFQNSSLFPIPHLLNHFTKPTR